MDTELDNIDFHVPVLLEEVMKFLQVEDHQIYFDGTFGAGGYSKKILSLANCKVIAVDQDDSVLKHVESLQRKFFDRLIFSQSRFSKIKEVIANYQVDQLDGIVLDIGVSSMQLDDFNRGFSFDSNQKLDMRMNKNQELSAFEIVNNFSEVDLANIIFQFGDEPKARKIAKKIINQRAKKTITSCCELADIVRSLYVGHYKTDPATRTFQAIRIAVNNELEELTLALNNAIDCLKTGGRMVIVSFHSLEDKIVKDFFRTKAGLNNTISRYDPFVINNISPQIKLQTKSAIVPGEDEVKKNPRSRSAKLRAIVKL
jgi:16S rRNA (cytosine1402-N4)-methyltransferase